MQAFGKPPARHHPAGKFVNDDDFIVAHDIIFVALEQLVRLQGLIEVMHNGDVLNIIQGLTLHHPGFGQTGFKLFRTRFGEGGTARFFIQFEIRFIQTGNIRIDLHIEL